MDRGYPQGYNSAVMGAVRIRLRERPGKREWTVALPVALAETLRLSPQATGRWYLLAALSDEEIQKLKERGALVLVPDAGG